MKLKKCKPCGIYTLRETCPNCGGPASSPHPPKFSPLDPYGKYRRMLKKQAGGDGNEKNCGKIPAKAEAG